MFVGHKQKGIVCDATNGSFTKGGGGETWSQGRSRGGGQQQALPPNFSVSISNIIGSFKQK